jgi:hypothetical protein
MTGMADCDVYDWVGPVINSAHWSMRFVDEWAGIDTLR